MIAPTSGSVAAAPFTEARGRDHGLGATAVPLTAPNRPTTAKIVDREFKRDLDAYLAPYGTLDRRHRRVQRRPRRATR